jgi:hypothetical protein
MRALRALGILILTAGSAAAQASSARTPLDGVWLRVAGTVNGEVITNQTGYRMFVDGHYGQVWVNGLAPRPLLPGTAANAAQIRASLQPLNAAAGTYEITSMQTSTQRTIVAYNPGAMQPGTYGIYQHRIVGDTLWSSQIMTQNGPVASPQTGKYVRQRAGGPSPLDGAWKLVDTRAGDGTITRNQPGMRFFVDGHFGTVLVNGTAPRPTTPLAPDATAEQLTAVYGPFTAQAGTFEVSGQTITTRPLVAKDPAVMVSGNFSRLTYRIRGDSLWLSQVETQAGPVANPTTSKYVRARPTSAATN